MRALEEHRYFGFTKIERKNILQKKKKLRSYLLLVTAVKHRVMCCYSYRQSFFDVGRGGGVNREGICYKLGRIKWDLVQRAAI